MNSGRLPRVSKKNSKKKSIRFGATLVKFNIGHFYISGFFTVGEKCFYFSWHNDNSDLLYRAAKNDEDYYGGQNHYVRIQEGMAKKMHLS